MTVPERVGGRYRLEEPLARGGMASVYRGHDEQLDRPVAIKLMRPELGDEPAQLRRFEAEALHAASVSHPNLVAVYDVGTEDGTPYIVMELVEGGDLATALARERPMDPRRAARIGAEVADALATAHATGLIHRDVKPGNILLDADGRARVADFGIARAVGDESLTQTGAMLGSVEYFSPEQAQGKPATAVSDIYALGVVLYELVAGERPFRGETPYAVATARLRRPPPNPRTANGEVPADLAAIIQRAMNPLPKDRYQSAADLRASLREWLDRPLDRPGTAILAQSSQNRGASGPDRPRRSRPGWLPAAWLAALAMLAVGGYFGWHALLGWDQEPLDEALEIIAGTPGGEAMAPTPTPAPSPASTPDAATTEPATTPKPTQSPAPASPATPDPELDSPEATPGAVAVADSPVDAVDAFYRRVTEGRFDAAYALWSDRMKAAYPRQENLDGRFAESASITFSELRVASQTTTTATVQANFTERYAAGGSRQFIGYWRLIRVDGAWLLDEPNY